MKRININAIHYASMMKIIQILGGISVLICITRFLDDVERGVYFACTGIISIQIFFELGIGTTFTQYISAEYQRPWKVNNINNVLYADKSASLIKTAIRWYLYTFLFLLLLIFIVGFVFFRGLDIQVNWLLPWFLISTGTALNYLYSGLSAICEGMRLIVLSNKVKVVTVTVQFFTYSFLLFFDFGLYFVGIGLILSAIVGLALLIVFCFEQLQEILEIKVLLKYSWFKEIFPFQWRMSLSLISGFFIFSMITPVFLKLNGPVFAGQVGLSLSILSSIQFLALNWIYVNVPFFSFAVEKKKWLYLNKLFLHNFYKAILICGLFLLAMNLTLYCVKLIHFSLFDFYLSKILPFKFLVILSLNTFLNIFSFSFATYVRSFKKEPFVYLSLFNAFINVCLFFYLSEYIGTFGLFLGSLCIALFTVFYTYRVFRKYRNLTIK